MRAALFLDRDGVINLDHGYVHRPEDFHFVDGIFELVAEAVRLDFVVVVVTNQAGIGRGLYSEAQFHALTEWMCAEFARRGGAIARVYYCPDHPEHGIGAYRRDSPRRKPRPGMLLDAQRDFDLDLHRCLLVGDRMSDIEAGRAAGVGCTILLQGDAGPSAASQPFPIVISHLREVLPILRARSAA